MNFEKLPSNSEQLLIELVQCENPTELLSNRFKEVSYKEDEVLRGILRELKESGFLSIMWADNKPYFVTINNSARTYVEQLTVEAAESIIKSKSQRSEKTMIFISHRSTDKEFADMLVDFFSGTGIPRTSVFCSSLPGNDINEKISGEVKAALKGSAVNIAILSQDYYKSAYCLNEAGILWYCDNVPVIPIALPEINSNNMYGFLGNEYKLRHLDSDDDISYIYDTVSEAVDAPLTKHSIITYENQKLKGRYMQAIGVRGVPTVAPIKTMPAISISEITTDDERIVLYYMLKKSVRKVSKDTIRDWLHQNEIYDVNVDNAFDLLSSFADGAVVNNTLEFGLEAFRKYSAEPALVIPELKECVDQHTKLAAYTFKNTWDSGDFDSVIRLFVAYIVDEKMRSFGDRWMADGQVESIQQWEGKNILEPVLSSNYGSCLEFFIQNDFVYESGWTSYGNPREYSLCPSLQVYLFNCPAEIAEELQRVKEQNQLDFPF